MLEKIDLSQTLDKQDAKLMLDELTLKLASLQRECRELGIPVIFAFEGPGASGKSTQINQLIHAFDPRGFQVFASQRLTEEDRRHSLLWRFWIKTPAKGRIAVFDCSWYRNLILDRFSGDVGESRAETVLEDIKNFEQQLTADGTLIVKFYLHISQKEQKKRLRLLRSSKKTAWRVSELDIRCCKHYDDYLKLADRVLVNTDFDFCPWTIVEANDRAYAAVRIAAVAAERMSHAIEQKKAILAGRAEDISLPQAALPACEGTQVLSQVDLSPSISRDVYREKLKKLQKKLALLHSELHKQNVPVVLAFEGWDAAGKGGAIKRLTEALDPCGYQVNPTASPNDIERQHHYLWRFWINMPKSGHIAIFDRTWYGRVMVERIEGFCSENEWKRAYQEINAMESHLANAGTIILKFWLHIDKDEQERRFNERMNTPEKRWKITDEDWRNREKWDQYEEAVNEMLLRTSTPHAPWIVIEGNDKYYARIKVLKTVIDALEKRLD